MPWCAIEDVGLDQGVHELLKERRVRLLGNALVLAERVRPVHLFERHLGEDRDAHHAVGAQLGARGHVDDDLEGVAVVGAHGPLHQAERATDVAAALDVNVDE